MNETATKPRSCHTLTVRFDDITPTIWRQIVVPSGITLFQLHNAIQAATGWTNSHLFIFEIGQGRYGFPNPDLDFLEDADTVTVASALPDEGSRAHYEYDFGDSWGHSITVDSISESDQGPAVLAGANACPPEDCGGWPGYEDLLAAQVDPKHERHEEITEWLGFTFDPTYFDLNAADTALKATIQTGQ